MKIKYKFPKLLREKSKKDKTNTINIRNIIKF